MENEGARGKKEGMEGDREKGRWASREEEEGRIRGVKEKYGSGG